MFESNINNIQVLTINQRKRDSVSELLSVIEKIKNIFVSLPMYGQGKSLIIEPLFVILLSNNRPFYNRLSANR